MVIVDTTVWIDYLGGARNPESDWLDRELQRQRLGLTDLILCEVLQSYRHDRLFERVLRELHGFEIMEAGGSSLAIAAARISGDFGRKVIPYARRLIAGLRRFASAKGTRCSAGIGISILLKRYLDYA